MDKFKAGDKVRVARKITDCFGASWVPEMDADIGKVYTIRTIKDFCSSGIHNVTFTDYTPSRSGWTFPLASLEHLNGYIDGVEVSHDEFVRRTTKPRKMSLEEISMALGYPVELNY